MTDPGEQTIVDSLHSDHRAVQAMLDEPGVDGESEESLAQREQLVMTLVRHFVGEEEYLYPTLREHLDVSDSDVDAGLGADRKLEKELRGLEDLDLTPERLHDVLATVRADFAAHVERQEPQLTQLSDRVPRELLDHLGADLRGAEMVAPTSPRRVVTSSESANKIISFVEGFVERARDYYTGRGTDDETRTED